MNLSTTILLVSSSSFAGQLICDTHSLQAVGFDSVVQVFASTDFRRWEPRCELAANGKALLTPTNRAEFFRARVKPAPARISFASLSVTGSVFVLSGSADKVLIDLRCEQLKGRLVQQHFGVSNKASILTAVDFTFPPQTLATGTNLLHCSFLDIDNNRIVTNVTVVSYPGVNAANWNTNGVKPFISITAHSFASSYTYWDDSGVHSKESSGTLTQPDLAVDLSIAKDHYGNGDVCSATYSGTWPYLYLDEDDGPCIFPDWRIYPASMEFGSYTDHYDSDAFSRSCNSAVNLYLPGNGSHRLHVTVQFSVCRWVRDGSYGDEMNDCLAVQPPFYIGGVQPNSDGAITFDTTDGTQWDISPTLAPMNSGWFDYDVDYTISAL